MQRQQSEVTYEKSSYHKHTVKTRGKSARKKMDVERVRQKFDAAKSKHNIDFEAKEEQLKIAMTVMGGRNVLRLLPTGYGKTLCMFIPTMLSEEESITLVISPLTSLIDDQMCSLKSKNFSCAKISAIGDMDNAVISGTYDLQVPRAEFCRHT
jgi:Lhr-like helicase